MSAGGGGVVLYIAASLDGRIADAGGSVAFLDRYGDGAEGYGEFISGVGGILMGRATFDFVMGAGAWPYSEIPTIVLTHRPARTPDSVTTMAVGVGEAIARLRASAHGRAVWIVGGGDVIAQALAAEAIDEVRLFLVPEILGGGARLFPDGSSATRWELRGTRSFASGAVELAYSRVNTPR